MISPKAYLQVYGLGWADDAKSNHYIELNASSCKDRIIKAKIKLSPFSNK